MTATITILRQTPDQTIPRPFARASSLAEVAEIIAHTVTVDSGSSRKQVEAFVAFARDNVPTFLTPMALDTESPIYFQQQVGDKGTRFYAFTEGQN